MNYNNSSVRRQDRLLPEPEALKLLKEGEYGVLSLITGENRPYGIPISYAWYGENSIFLHSAPEGKKIISLQNYSEVSFCITSKADVITEKFSTFYESIILECKAFTSLSDDEKRRGLLFLVQKYSPDHIEKGTRYADSALKGTEVIRPDIMNWSGKRK